MTWGRLRFRLKFLTKGDLLLPKSSREVKKHAEYGFEILRKNKDINLLSAHVALQHQERWDGSGYPR
ncbi:MAG: HD domain-containing phosphohydrolase, partial [Desulfitobacterium sp.]